MRQTAGRKAETPHVTHELARFASGIRYEDLPAPVRFMARQCLLDWLGVTLAGFAGAACGDAEGGSRRGRRRAARDPVRRRRPGHRWARRRLVNGAAGHALDFDDVLGAMTGHPTAAGRSCRARTRGRPGPRRPPGRRRHRRRHRGRSAPRARDRRQPLCEGLACDRHGRRLRGGGRSSEHARPRRGADGARVRHRRHPGRRAQIHVRDHVQAAPRPARRRATA